MKSGRSTSFPIWPRCRSIPACSSLRNFELVRDGLKTGRSAAPGPPLHRSHGPRGRRIVQGGNRDATAYLRARRVFALELNDYPGQATGTVGILDVFWDSKGLIAPERWRRFCSPVVPLLRFPKRVYTSAEKFAATAEVANYGPRDLPAVTASWSVRDDANEQLAAGDLPTVPATTGKVTALGRVEVPLALSSAPTRLRVCLTLNGAELCERLGDLGVSAEGRRYCGSRCGGQSSMGPADQESAGGRRESPVVPGARRVCDRRCRQNTLARTGGRHWPHCCGMASRARPPWAGSSRPPSGVRPLPDGIVLDVAVEGHAGRAWDGNPAGRYAGGLPADLAR